MTCTALALAVPVALALTVLDVTALLLSTAVTCRATTEAEEVDTTELDESVDIAVEERPESVAEALDD